MTIGLIRHFKVDLPFNKPSYLPDEFDQQMERYDTAPVIPNKVIMNGIKWDVCYCSDLPRAQTTAKSVWVSDFNTTSLLREVPISAFTKRQIKLPGFLWHLGARISWRKNGKSQPETFAETIKRIEKLYEIIVSDGNENILLVTHGFFIRVFQEHMKKKGFSGEVDFRPVNGKLYVLKNI